jgi:hypothetical protein
VEGKIASQEKMGVQPFGEQQNMLAEDQLKNYGEVSSAVKRFSPIILTKNY